MSDASAVSELLARLELLERRTVRLKRLFFVTLVALICAATAAGTVAQQRSLSFKDAAGNTVRIDSAGFHLIDAKGRARIKLGYNVAHAPALSMYDDSGTERMQIHVATEHGTPAIVLLDPQGRARMFVGLTPDSPTEPRLEFRDASSHQRLYVGLSTEESGMLSIYNAHEKKMLDLQDTYLRIHDTDSTERLYLGLSPSDRPFLEMWDPSHTERSYFGTYTDGDFGASIYDSSGESAWHTP